MDSPPTVSINLGNPQDVRNQMQEANIVGNDVNQEIARNDADEEEFTAEVIESERGEEPSLQRVPTEISEEETGFESSRKSLIEVTLSIAAITFGALFTIVGGMKDSSLEQRIMGKTIAFNIFVLSDSVAFLTSSIMAVILVTETTPRRVVQFSKRIVWVTTICAVLAFLAAAYMMLPSQTKWVQLVVAVGSLAVICSSALIWLLRSTFKRTEQDGLDSLQTIV